MSAPERPPVLNKNYFFFGYFVCLVVSAAVIFPTLAKSLEGKGDLSAGSALLAALVGSVALVAGGVVLVYPFVVEHYAKLRLVNGEMRDLADQQFQYLREALDQAKAREQVLQAYIEKLAATLARNEQAAENSAVSARSLQDRWETLLDTSGQSVETQAMETLAGVRADLGEALGGLRQSLAETAAEQRQTAASALAEIRLALSESVAGQEAAVSSQAASISSLVAELREGAQDSARVQQAGSLSVLTEVQTRLADLVQIQQASQEKALADLRSRLSELASTQEQLSSALPALVETRDRLQTLSQGLPREETMQATLDTLKDRTMFFGQQFVEIKNRLEAADQRALALQELFQQMVSTTANLSKHLPSAPAKTSPVVTTRSSSPVVAPVVPAASAPLPPPPPADADDEAVAAEDAEWWNSLDREVPQVSSPSPAPAAEPVKPAAASRPSASSLPEDLFAVAKQGSSPVSLRDVNWDADDTPAPLASAPPVTSGGGGAQALRKPVSLPSYLTRATRAPFAISNGAGKVVRHKADNPSEIVVVGVLDLAADQVLFLRGEGSGLFKTAGVPMVNVVKGVWEWRVQAFGPVTFRFHLNDETASQLGELTAHPGEMIEITDPKF